MTLLMSSAVSGNPFRIGNEGNLTVEEFHVLVKTLPLASCLFPMPPDIKWHYSNIGDVLLAILIDEVSGKTLRERLLTTMFKEP